ncbi:MAG: DUF4493 domain-containing protein [Muribaculaceae bacterium]|nr:DUF4493 domain-containing protein [Muribaculaceae bacterium]
MKKYISIALAAASLAIAGGCDKEHPFEGGSDENGFLSREALELELKNEEHIARAGSPDVFQSKVEFVNASGEVVREYRYADMPEVVTLPVGEYTARAIYGDNPVAAWDSPYYRGESKFRIVADKITTDVDPVVCRLSNVKVTITFDESLASRMGDDAKVTVKAGQSGTLDFTLADQSRAGFFAYDEGSSLTATFSGTIDGYYISETKAYDVVQVGTHYSINFKMRTLEPGSTGQIKPGGIVLDATVAEENVTGDIDPTMPPQENDMRPVEGSETPQPPVDPDKDITKLVRIYGDGFDIEQEQQIEDMETTVIMIETEKPISGFTVDIISNTLTPDELEGVGLGDHLDLVNPGEFEDAITGLFFEDEGYIKVPGETEVKFDLTPFMSLLTVLGEGHHTFRLTVTTDDGSRTVELKLRNN